VQDFVALIKQACPEGQSLILDSEVLMLDGKGQILPFGTLGIHKKQGFKDAHPCLFIFDLLAYNGRSLLVRVEGIPFFGKKTNLGTGAHRANPFHGGASY
jgi:DNA ligase-3